METYHYDDGGRLETITRDGESWELEYNADDLIIEVKKDGEIVVQYTYDSSDRRVEMSDGEGERDYLVAPLLGDGLESPHLVMDELANPMAAYVYAGSMPLMRLDEEGNPVYYLEDGMGSIVGLADNSGVELAEFEYDSFGNLRGESVIANELGGDFRFQGQWLESNTDLYHFRARYYDPETGRFVSRDPVDVIEYEPESSNPYQFVYNNPRIYSDPTGMVTFSELNIRNVIADILNHMQTQLVGAAKDEVINKAKGVVSNLITDWLNDALPIQNNLFNTVDTLLQSGKDPGEAIENFILNLVLKPIIIGANLDHFFHNEPVISPRNGKPYTNGYQFSEPPVPGGKFPKGTGEPTLTKPDFVISAIKPMDTNVTNRSWLIGDLKTKVKNIRKDVFRPTSQWEAIAEYAKNRQYVPIALEISLYNYDEMEINKIKAEALSEPYKVVLFILPLTNIHKK